MCLLISSFLMRKINILLPHSLLIFPFNLLLKSQGIHDVVHRERCLTVLTGQHICITIQNYFDNLVEKQAMVLFFLRSGKKASPQHTPSALLRSAQSFLKPLVEGYHKNTLSAKYPLALDT